MDEIHDPRVFTLFEAMGWSVLPIAECDAIAQTLGILMARYDCDRHRAAAMLVAVADARGLTAYDVARTFVTDIEARAGN